MLHLGVLSGLVGCRELRLYGTTPSREGGNRAA
jgi:hypothetical protein